MKNTQCYCGEEGGEPVSSFVRDSGSDNAVVRCSGCGVVRKKDFAGHVEFHRHGRQVEEIDLDTLSRDYTRRNMVDVKRRVRTLRPVLESAETVLDFGTGMGYFLDAVSPLVDLPLGTEINEKRIKFVREKLGYDVFRGTDQALKKLNSESVDVVTMYHALEHTRDPVSQLSSMRELLGESGILVVEVPNHHDALLRFSGQYEKFYYQNAHSYYFDNDTLSAVLRRGGFCLNELRFVQRYGWKNAAHWLLRGEPQIDSPNRNRGMWTHPADKLFSAALSVLGATDTITAIAFPE